MQFTDEASQFLGEHLKANGYGGIVLQASGHGCHMRIGMDFTDGSEGEIINGIKVLMDDESKACLENIIVDRKDRQLIFMFQHGCGGCGSDEGCGSGCEDDGCEGGCCH